MLRSTLIFALPSLFLTITAIDINHLSLDEKIGQMIIVATVSNPDYNKEFMASIPYHLEPSYVQKMIQEHHIGGVLFMGKSIPSEQVTITNTLQALSTHPLFIFQDAEWGLSMRMADNVIVYPKAMTLGALCPADDDLIYENGLIIGKQLRALGIHSSLSPVCDVNTNPKNPIINMRSFGEDPHTVARKAVAMMEGLRDSGTLPCAKHFPGHGNTSSDSHHALPFIPLSKAALDAVELIPFKALIHACVPAIMMAHIDVPSLTQQPGMPTSLSYEVITNTLRQTLGFDGLIMPDGLGMRGITDGRTERAIAIDAIKAGNDLLLCPVDVPCAIASIKDAISQGILSEHDIDTHVARIVRAKHLLSIERSVTYDGQQLMTPHALALKKQLYTTAITLARNEHNRLPLTQTTAPIAVITIGQADSLFMHTLQSHLPITHYALPITASVATCDQLYEQLQEYSHIIISLHLPSRSGMIELATENMINNVPPYVAFINRLGTRVTLVLFGNPYNVAHLPASGATIIAYENEPEAQEAAALTILGKHNPRGQLPVTASPTYPAGRSLSYS